MKGGCRIGYDEIRQNASMSEEVDLLIAVSSKFVMFNNYWTNKVPKSICMTVWE
jgi:hypothetical protein